MEKKKPRKKYYIQPEHLRVEILEYKNTGIASERLGEMLIQIASGLAAGSKWDRRTYRDDMAGDAVVRMYKNLTLIDTTDPLDLSALCLRDFNKNAQIKYSEVVPSEEVEAIWQSCVISSFDPLFDYCSISIFEYKKKKVPLMLENGDQALDKHGKLAFEEIEEIVFTKEIEKVTLDHLLFKKTNPFSYLTMIAHRVYLSRSIKENKNDDGLNEYREECYSAFESAECISNRSASDGDMDTGVDMDMMATE